jgi:lysophospholipase
VRHSTTFREFSHPPFFVPDSHNYIRLWPLLNPARGVDFIMAFDSSADTTYFWPNGTAMIATYNRTIRNDDVFRLSMANVPTNQNSWVNLGLNARPTFFGCDARDVTNYNASAGVSAPVIAYIPAYPWSTFANTSTYQLSYAKDASKAHLDNGLQSTTLNGTVRVSFSCITTLSDAQL